jgi:carboxyl-terminal processing protease
MIKKFLKIMMNRKVLPVVLIVLIGGSLWAFKSKGSNDGSPLAKQQQLLAAVGYFLEQRHYDPKKIDDDFSKKIFKKYLETLDADKDMFLASDIDSLKQYETSIDDEIHGTPIKFYPAVETVYNQRLAEVKTIFRDVLSKPFDFTTDETVQLDRDKLNYPADDAERKEVWRKRLKYLTLDRFVELQDERSKSVIDSVKNQSDADLEKIARTRVLQGMNRNFARIEKTFDDQEFFNMFVYTITTEMDPHTEYFPPVEKRSFDEDMSGKFYGIGAQLKQDDDAIKIASLITGSPAWKSGKVQVNDAILKVGQGSAAPVDITGYGITDAVKLIRGEKGTEVRLTLKKADGSLQVIPIVRDEIVQDEATYARSTVIEENGKKVGYIFLPEFYADFDKPDGRRCSSDVAAEVQKLKDQHVEGIILDLRNNGGGYLYEVVQMAGLFIKSGPIVQVKDREGNPNVLSDNDTSVLYNGPLAVMVNEFSASASEIFAAAMQDYKRAIIIGSTTYGKGTVQKQIPLGKPVDYSSGETEYGALKLTFEKFYRVSGASTQLKGVTPDVVLLDPYEYSKMREKDNSSALNWDQIAKSDYTPWSGNVDWNKVESDAKKEIAQNKSFSTLQNNYSWLNKNVDKEYDLNINKYKAEEKTIRNIVTEDDSLSKLSANMNVSFLAVDKDQYQDNPDKAKAARYTEWLKALQKDIYINETVNVINDMADMHSLKVDAAR